jgi:hypothetical protein
MHRCKITKQEITLRIAFSRGYWECYRLWTRRARIMSPKRGKTQIARQAGSGQFGSRNDWCAANCQRPF